MRHFVEVRTWYLSHTHRGFKKYDIRRTSKAVLLGTWKPLV